MYITTVWKEINKETYYPNSVPIFQFTVGGGRCIVISKKKNHNLHRPI